jgi:hypothetical protein
MQHCIATKKKTKYFLMARWELTPNLFKKNHYKSDISSFFAAIAAKIPFTLKINLP